MMMAVYRDLGFFIVGLLLYDILLFKKMIMLYEAVALAGITFLYIFVIF